MRRGTIGCVEVVDLLVRHGAVLDRPAADGRAPLHMAAFNGHLASVNALIDAGAAIDQPAALTNGAGEGHTPLLLASYQGHDKVDTPLCRLALLCCPGPVFPCLSFSVSVSQPEAVCFQPVLFSLRHFSTLMLSNRFSRKVVKALLKAGANPNVPSKDGATALVAAAAAGQAKIVKILLKNGADPRRRLRSGETPSMLTSDRSIGALLVEAERDAWERERKQVEADRDESEETGASSGSLDLSDQEEETTSNDKGENFETARTDFKLRDPEGSEGGNRNAAGDFEPGKAPPRPDTHDSEPDL